MNQLKAAFSIKEEEIGQKTQPAPWGVPVEKIIKDTDREVEAELATEKMRHRVASEGWTA
jgi:hypothetical protein